MKMEEEPVNLRSIHSRIAAGDEQATGEFYNWVSTHIPHKTFSGLPDSEDLREVVAIKATNNFGQFVPPEDPAVFDQTVTSWVKVISRNVARDQLRKLRRTSHLQTSNINVNDLANQTQEEEPTNSLLTTSSLSEVLREKAEELLRPTIFAVVDLSLQGKRIEEIAELTRLSRVNVRARLSRGRKVLVERFITPAGFEPATRFSSSAGHAASEGRINSLKFLGVYYITAEVAENYLRQTPRFDPEFAAQGYELASQALSFKEYNWAKNLGIMRKHQGRLYVHKDQMDQIRNRPSALPFRVTPPAPEYRRLSSFVETYAEYTLLREAASKGRLAAIQQGRWWWTTPEAVSTFRVSIK